ncbi:MAG: alpha/beta fold hydrolase [Thermoplasmata archaeon]|nr:alpha/beta fold hydrolase [Thermoplasmata archaeon]
MKGSVETGYLPASDGKLYYERKGDGFPLVLVHSGFLDRRMWDPQFESFSPQYSVIRYDVRGYGRSQSGSGPYVDADDLGALFDHLGLSEAFVVGNSNGARIAAAFAAGSPEQVRGLVLVGGGPGDFDPTEEEEQRFMDTFPDRDGKILDLAAEGKRAESVDAMLEAWAPAVDDTTRTYLREIATENFTQVVASISGELPLQKPAYPIAEGLRQSSIPMLFLCGSRDHPSLGMMMGRFAQQVAKGKFVEIAGADHTANLSARSEFDRQVRAFFDGIAARPASAT